MAPRRWRHWFLKGFSVAPVYCWYLSVSKLARLLRFKPEFSQIPLEKFLSELRELRPGFSCDICKRLWLQHGCSNSGSFTRTRLFLIKGKAKNDTKGFSLLFIWKLMSNTLTLIFSFSFLPMSLIMLLSHQHCLIVGLISGCALPRSSALCMLGFSRSYSFLKLAR